MNQSGIRPSKSRFTGEDEFQRIMDFLGGEKVFHHRIHSSLEAHQLISDGFPGGVLNFLLKNIGIFRDPDLLQKAVGVSLRTLQRKASPHKALTEAQSGRAWKFAEIMAKATQVMGSQEEAERWMTSPAMALDQRRPIDLLSTPAGVELVEDLLIRLEYGVYA